MDLMINMISLCHFFGVFFHGLALNEDRENNWVYKFGLHNINILDKYVICCYFALTTIVTVGYGDFTP